MNQTAALDRVRYLDTVARSAQGTAYKHRLMYMLDIVPGHTVVDVGCGPGTDLGWLADASGASATSDIGGGDGHVTGHDKHVTGHVIGIDHDERMVAEARRRLVGRSHVAVHVGDAHALPFADASVDRVRFDRVIQHLADPVRAIAEVYRVLRPGGLFAAAEPDWDTLALADDDIQTSRDFARFTASRVRNATVGRQLVRLATQAGFQVEQVEAIPVLVRDFVLADQIFGLARNSARAVAAGVMAEESVAPWLVRLRAEPFLASVTMYIVVAGV